MRNIFKSPTPPWYLEAAVIGLCVLILWPFSPRRATPVVPAPKPYWLVLTPDGIVAATLNPSTTVCTPGWTIPGGIQFKVVRMPSKYDDPCLPKSWDKPAYGARIAEEK